MKSTLILAATICSFTSAVFAADPIKIPTRCPNINSDTFVYTAPNQCSLKTEGDVIMNSELSLDSTLCERIKAQVEAGTTIGPFAMLDSKNQENQTFWIRGCNYRNHKVNNVMPFPFKINLNKYSCVSETGNVEDSFNCTPRNR